MSDDIGTPRVIDGRVNTPLGEGRLVDINKLQAVILDETGNLHVFDESKVHAIDTFTPNEIDLGDGYIAVIIGPRQFRLLRDGHYIRTGSGSVYEYADLEQVKQARREFLGIKE